jgi:hypothetical protein
MNFDTFAHLACQVMPLSFYPLTEQSKLRVLMNAWFECMHGPCGDVTLVMALNRALIAEHKDLEDSALDHIALEDGR